jgi:hypothetical protein
MEIAGTMPDAGLDSAVASIMKKIPDEAARVDVNGNDLDDLDVRENREERDITERQGTSDLEEAEREAKAQGDGEAGEDDPGAEEFIELPPETEGGEPTRIPAKEAADAWQKLRQMDGEIATAVIKAEETAFAKQDEITQQLRATFDTVRQQAQLSLQMLNAYAPREPDPRDFHTTEDYYQAKLSHDNYWKYYDQVSAKLKAAESGINAVSGQQDGEITRREMARAERFIPGYGDEKTRVAKHTEWLDVLGPRYGVSKEDIEGIADHKALRILNDLASRIAAEKKAPEVRKAVQDKAPKITKSRTNPNRDTGTGRFVSDARKQLKETGSEAAFAQMLLRSGALDNI